MSYITQAGHYEVTVKQAYLGESSKTGTPYLGLVLETEEGQTIESQSWLSDKALEVSVRSLRQAFNFDNDFDNLDQFLGKQTTVTVEVETYQGKDRAKVKYLSQRAKPVFTGGASRFSEMARRIPDVETPKAAPPPKAERTIEEPW